MCILYLYIYCLKILDYIIFIQVILSYITTYYITLKRYNTAPIYIFLSLLFEIIIAGSYKLGTLIN